MTEPEATSKRLAIAASDAERGSPLADPPPAKARFVIGYGPWISALAAAVVAIGFGVAVFLHRAADGAGVTKVTAPVAKDTSRDGVLSATAQLAAHRMTGWQTSLDLLSAERAQPAAGFVEPMRLSPPYDAIDSVLFDTLDTRVRLAHVLPVGRNEICFDKGRQRFACGLMARAALQNFIAGKPIDCLPQFGPPGSTVLEATCRIEGLDLARYLVERGQAFAMGSGNVPYAEEERRARENGVGVWAGPWVASMTDPSKADGAAIPFGSLRTRQVDPATLAPPEPTEAPAPPVTKKTSPKVKSGSSPAP